MQLDSDITFVHLKGGLLYSIGDELCLRIYKKAVEEQFNGIVIPNDEKILLDCSFFKAQVINNKIIIVQNDGQMVVYDILT